MTTFDPNQVPIQYTFNVQQVNLILRGLGKMPFDEVEGLYLPIRQVALQTLSNAETAAKEQPAELPTDQSEGAHAD